MKTTQSISVAITDDEHIFREGVKLVLKKSPTIKIIGEATSAYELDELIKHTTPDILLTNIHLESTDIVPGIGKIVREFPEMKVVVLSHHYEDVHVINTIEAGV